MGGPATHSDNVLDCGEPNVSRLARKCLGRRFGYLEFQWKNFAYVGMGLTQGENSLAQLAEEKFMDALNPTPTMPSSWESSPRLQSIDEVAAPRPDICARLAQVANKVASTELMVSSRQRTSGNRPRL